MYTPPLREDGTYLPFTFVHPHFSVYSQFHTDRMEDKYGNIWTNVITKENIIIFSSEHRKRFERTEQEITVDFMLKVE